MFLTSPLVGRAIAFTAEVGFPKDRPAREGPWGQGEDVGNLTPFRFGWAPGRRQTVKTPCRPHPARDLRA